MSMIFRTIAARDLGEELLAVWRRIRGSVPGLRSPYFSPEFTQLTATVREKVSVTVIECDGRPVGFLPFQRGSWRVGRPVAGPLSDYHGLIMDPSLEVDLSALIRSAELRVLAFDHVPAFQSSFERHAWSRGRSPAIDLSGGFDAYVDGFRAAGSDYVTRSSRMVRKIEREVGPLSFSFHEPSDEAIDFVFAWKDAQYLASGSPAVFREHEWARILARSIANGVGDELRGAVSVLRSGSKIVAAHLGMRSGDVLHWWFPTYDPQFERYSPGTILLLRIAEAAGSEAIRIIDLGKGDSRYKLTAMNVEVPLLEGAVELPSMTTCWRRLQRVMDARAHSGGAIWRAAALPFRAIRRREHRTRFR